ncbi:sulfotransferase [Luteolibacter sp. LG18]|uniref:sulfotransferase family protein n=1 Tax=Luteolibacter sp. LG18 TaxID=2819286 RepID=UPI002B2807AF|nr:PAPS-dependent sulfotransferase Stf3 [Luteolibacter sp. LG18]
MGLGELKHQHSTDNHPLIGLTFSAWWRMLRENRFRVSPVYWRRVVMLTGAAAINSHFKRRERAHEPAIRATEVDAPLFILGHWRSGTTHLHNLLALDRERFAAPTTYQALAPSTFLTTEDRAKRAYADRIPETRPMDNMALGFDLPQEDEFALWAVTTRSPYMAFAFPEQADRYERYLTFEGVPAEEVEEWKEALLWFCRKLTYKHGPRRLVLKSPAHTARIRLLLKLFPDARFIHLHRHPHDVFRSFRHYHDTAAWFSYLQRPDRTRVEDWIIRGYRALHDAYFAQRSLIPEGRLCEVRFEELDRDPVGTVERIYRTLSLDGFEGFQPVLENAVTRQEGYQKNRFEPLEERLRKRLAREWQREFEAWGYDP